MDAAMNMQGASLPSQGTAPALGPCLHPARQLTGSARRGALVGWQTGQALAIAAVPDLNTSRHAVLPEDIYGGEGWRMAWLVGAQES